MSSRRARSRRRRHVMSVARDTTPRPARIRWIVIVLVVIACATAAGFTPRGQDILAAVQRFMLFYSGVLALVALTAAVGVGIMAADRIVMTPSGRVVGQAVHRAVSLAALAFLVTHIVLEILARRSQVIDAFVPFMARGRTFYVGLGTIASDLVIVLIVTGVARGRFAERWPWTWRAIHATAYLAWPLAIVHGLLAGRSAKPYVDWSYGGCLAAVGLALIVRQVATVRGRKETAAHPVADRAAAHVQAPARSEIPWMAAMPALPAMGEDQQRCYPPSAMPGGWPTAPRALPAGAFNRQAAPPEPPCPQGTPYLSARRYSLPPEPVPPPSTYRPHPGTERP